LKLSLEVELKGIEGVSLADLISSEIKSSKKITIKAGVTDIVRIFEAMKEAEIISKKTEVSQIADLFFNTAEDKKKFIATYNARKSDITNLDRSSNSTELEEFIITLIEKSFVNKDKVLENLVSHIEQLQKNRIY
jgi:hypothetical protein